MRDWEPYFPNPCIMHLYRISQYFLYDSVCPNLEHMAGPKSKVKTGINIQVSRVSSKCQHDQMHLESKQGGGVPNLYSSRVKKSQGQWKVLRAFG